MWVNNLLKVITRRKSIYLNLRPTDLEVNTLTTQLPRPIGMCLGMSYIKDGSQSPEEHLQVIERHISFFPVEV